MQEFKFNVTGTNRKTLAGAISEILNAPMKYLGAPTFAYEVGGYHIDKNGLVTGEHDLNLFVGLAGRGFEPEQNPTEETTVVEETPAAEEIPKNKEPESPAVEKTTADTETEITRLVIEYPLNGFTPEAIDNLTKMVLAKEALLKKALGAEELPIQIPDDQRIAFPWFSIDTDSDTATAYTQFIAALCKTAKEKKRVTAKAPEAFENEKFAMRVWLIGLGLIGAEFGAARKLLMRNLGGDSGWRYGKPEKAAPFAGMLPTMNNFPSDAEVLRLRAQYAPGTRIELTAPMQDPYAKLNAGERATVRGVDDAGHILCRWDAGSSLNLIPGVDQFKIVGVFTEEIKLQILAIRAEGQTNMFDITTVQRFAYEKDFFALVNFIEDDRAAYFHFILRGE